MLILDEGLRGQFLTNTAFTNRRSVHSERPRRTSTVLKALSPSIYTRKQSHFQRTIEVPEINCKELSNLYIRVNYSNNSLHTNRSLFLGLSVLSERYKRLGRLPLNYPNARFLRQRSSKITIVGYVRLFFLSHLRYTSWNKKKNRKSIILIISFSGRIWTL